MVKSCSMVGTTEEMNFRKKNRLFSTFGSPPFCWIYVIIDFITVAWLQGCMLSWVAWRRGCISKVTVFLA